eukprot:TRINITY_DN12216_c0_g1_i1.p1 TRINITY_DN12216_c0_g1~~TRINITY_DN12216_c0_g1_i1.p1  ORF type:complete len:112 (+),score=5.88 TRINITY_DN12216_c0_g1_i1:18-353(+)
MPPHLFLPSLFPTFSSRCITPFNFFSRNFAGHSRWANIRHHKAVADLKKAQIFGKISREIISAVKLGGEDVSSNSRLGTLLEKARSMNMPKIRLQALLKRRLRKVQIIWKK